MTRTGGRRQLDETDSGLLYDAITAVPRESNRKIGTRFGLSESGTYRWDAKRQEQRLSRNEFVAAVATHFPPEKKGELFDALKPGVRRVDLANRFGVSLSLVNKYAIKKHKQGYTKEEFQYGRTHERLTASNRLELFNALVGAVEGATVSDISSTLSFQVGAETVAVWRRKKMAGWAEHHFERGWKESPPLPRGSLKRGIPTESHAEPAKKRRNQASEIDAAGGREPSTSHAGESAVTKAVAKKSKKPRMKSAYDIFRKEFDYEGYKAKHPDASMGDRLKFISAAWQATSDAEKQAYKDKAAAQNAAEQGPSVTETTEQTMPTTEGMDDGEIVRRTADRPETAGSQPKRVSQGKIRKARDADNSKQTPSAAGAVEGTQASSGKAKDVGGKKKKKRKTTPYNAYMKDALAGYKDEHPGVTHMDAFKAVAENWKTMDENEKQAYQIQADAMNANAAAGEEGKQQPLVNVSNSHAGERDDSDFSAQSSDGEDYVSWWDNAGLQSSEENGPWPEPSHYQFNFTPQPQSSPLCTHVAGTAEYGSGGAENYLQGVKWSPLGECLLTASNDNVVRVFDMPGDAVKGKGVRQGGTGGAVRESQPKALASALRTKPGESVYDYAWFPGAIAMDETSFCYGITCRAHPIKLISAMDGTTRGTYKVHDSSDELTSAYSIAFHPRNKSLVGGYKQSLVVFDLERPGMEGTVVSTISSSLSGLGGQRGIIKTMAFNPLDPNMLCCGCYDKTFAVYDMNAGCSMVHQGADHRGGVTQVQFDPAGNYLYTGARKDPHIKCWDVRMLGSGRTVYELSRRGVADTNQTIGFDIEPQGRHLLSGDVDGNVLCFDLRDGQLIRSFAVASDAVNGVSVHPSYPLIATASGSRHFDESKSETEEEWRPAGQGKGGHAEDANCLKIWKVEAERAL